MNSNIEVILDECLEQIRSGEDVETVLSRHPEVAEELRPLIELSLKLAALPDPTPPMGGMLRSMARSAALNVGAKRRGKTGFFRGVFARPTLARAVGLAAVFLLIVWGTLTTSSNAMPGDVLYPIKLLTERARFYLTIDREQKAELRIVFSAERLKEAIRQSERSGEVDEKLLASMLEEARLAVLEGASLPGTDYRLIVSRAAAITDYQKTALSDLRSRVPEPVRAKVSRWESRCEQRGRWMRDIMRKPPSHHSPRKRADRCMKDCPKW